MKQKQNVEEIIIDIKEKVNKLNKNIEETKNAVEKSQWHKEYTETEEQYKQAREKLESQGISPEKLDDLLERQKQKQAELENINRKKEEIKDLKSERISAESEYEKKLAEMRNYRQNFINSILSGTDDVQIEYIKKKSVASVKEMLKKYIKSNSLNVKDDIDKISKETISKSIDYLRDVIQKCRTEEKVSGVTGYFKKEIANLQEEEVDQIMAFIPGDELVVKYRPSHSKKFKPLNTASAGQKTTAILTFILAYGKTPLLLDQPEDDLDNRLVYDLVVKRLKESKKHRQLIVVTHNANIPVNGDAEYITSMDSESEYVKSNYCGTMDDEHIRDEICNVMEGTEYAFEMRAKKYHLQIGD